MKNNEWKNTDWKNGWTQTGEQIKDAVDNAIHTGDFRNLSHSVGDIVNNTLHMVKTNINNSIPYLNSNQEPHTSERAYTDSDAAHTSHSRTQKTDSRMQNSYTQTKKPYTRMHTSKDPAFYTKNPPGRAAGILMTVFGFLMMGIFLLLMLIFGIAGTVLHFLLIPFIAFSILTAIGLFLGISGVRQLNFIKRFQQYTFQLGERIYIPLQSLADKTGKSIAFTVRDLKKMIHQRLFYEGHLDTEGGYLILSDKAYQEYMTEKTNCANRRKEQEQKQASEKLSAECQKLMDDGQKYINHIRTSNNLIPDQKISKKLNRMEQVVVRIFDEVRKHPEVASDLQKMMDYYLPTTSKLLDAYRDLDAQPVEGENISSTKREISDTLDTLNTAFEKLLDSLFTNRAWDISSDISVLNTVLAQEGLTKNDF